MISRLTKHLLNYSEEYIYRYNADEDKISTWFVKEDTKQVDGKEEIDYLFHDIDTERVGPAVVCRGEHLCELDMYWAYDGIQCLVCQALLT